MRVNVEIDVGLHRGGVPEPEALTPLLAAIREDPEHLSLSGFMGYEPHLTGLGATLGHPAVSMDGAGELPGLRRPRSRGRIRRRGDDAERRRQSYAAHLRAGPHDERPRRRLGRRQADGLRHASPGRQRPGAFHRRPRPQALRPAQDPRGPMDGGLPALVGSQHAPRLLHLRRLLEGPSRLAGRPDAALQQRQPAAAGRFRSGGCRGSTTTCSCARPRANTSRCSSAICSPWPTAGSRSAGRCFTRQPEPGASIEDPRERGRISVRDAERS